MHEYDTILKRLLMRFSPATAAQLTGFEVRRWLNVELPEPRNLRVDLLGETAGGELFHIELQSRNDPDIARRMLECALAIYGQYRRRPEQLVLYTGEAPMLWMGSSWSLDSTVASRIFANSTPSHWALSWKRQPKSGGQYSYRTNAAS